MQMSVPLDNGFLRRECPNCEREFKWLSDENQEQTNEPSPTHYYCPYCGEPADLDSWWTTAQLEQAQAIAMGDFSQQFNDKFKDLERKTRGGIVEFKVTSNMDLVIPSPIEEPSDMVIVESPCHPSEPIKVLEDWSDPLHCLVCGEVFSLN